MDRESRVSHQSAGLRFRVQGQDLARQGEYHRERRGRARGINNGSREFGIHLALPCKDLLLPLMELKCKTNLLLPAHGMRAVGNSSQRERIARASLALHGHASSVPVCQHRSRNMPTGMRLA